MHLAQTQQSHSLSPAALYADDAHVTHFDQAFACADLTHVPYRSGSC